jgi:hypothetical protein
MSEPSEQSSPPSQKGPGKTAGKADLRDSAQRFLRLGRELTAGINRRELERLFDQEARGALSTLASRPGSAPAERFDLPHLLASARDLFLGMALKLSPGRRLLFLASLLFSLVGLLDVDLALAPGHLTVDFSPFFFLLSITGLVLLLALELVDRLRVRDEVEVARSLQRDLLPQETPLLPGYQIAHSYRTANDIGGDYYEFLPLEDGRWALAVGDASGHGISAGLLMAIANASLKTAIDLDPSPVAVLEFLNRVIYRTGTRRAFMSLFYGVLDPESGTLEYACGGHPFPLLRHADGTLEELGTGALPLGVRPSVSYRSARSIIQPGDLLLLYSDGLPEALGGEHDEPFGFDRLRSHLARSSSAHRVHDEILGAFERHLEGHPIADDLTLVAIGRIPPPPQGPPGTLAAATRAALQ